MGGNAGRAIAPPINDIEGPCDEGCTDKFDILDEAAETAPPPPGYIIGLAVSEDMCGAGPAIPKGREAWDGNGPRAAPPSKAGRVKADGLNGMGPGMGKLGLGIPPAGGMNGRGAKAARTGALLAPAAVSPRGTIGAGPVSIGTLYFHRQKVEIN